MDFTGSGFADAVSSSFMPFLKALMPWATSPIRSEILPRPNSSRTTAITTIQCQILSEPILQPSKQGMADDPAQSSGERRPAGCQKQGLPAPANCCGAYTLWLPLIALMQRSGTSFRRPFRAPRPAPAPDRDRRLRADLHPRAARDRPTVSEH